MECLLDTVTHFLHISRKIQNNFVELHSYPTRNSQIRKEISISIYSFTWQHQIFILCHIFYKIPHSLAFTSVRIRIVKQKGSLSRDNCRVTVPIGLLLYWFMCGFILIITVEMGAKESLNTLASVVRAPRMPPWGGSLEAGTQMTQ